MTGDGWLGAAKDDVQHEVWQLILLDHGRPDGGEQPELCWQAGRLAIFDSEDGGKAAVAALHEAGAPLLSVVPCEHEPHWHLRVSA